MTNKSDQAERRELAGGLSYHRQAQIDQELELGGRFAADTINSGSASTVDYPPLPQSSPSAGDSVGVEPPLGQDVNAQEPTGTAAEIEASLALAAPAASFGSQTTEASSSSVAERRAPPLLSPGSGGALSTSHERLAEILPRLARPTIRKRKV
jgi:hypothetical protein